MNKIIILIFFMLLLTGCGNSKELENRDYVMAIGIDDKNGYDVSVAVAKLSYGSDNKKQEETIYKANGKTINEAISVINNKTKGNLYLGHNKVMVLSENYKDYDSLINYVSNNIEISRDTVVVKAKNPEEILKSQNNEDNASDYIYDYYNDINKVDLDKIMDYYNKKENINLPAVVVEDKNIIIK